VSTEPAAPLDDPQAELRRRLIAARQALPDRLERAVQLQSVLRVWLVSRPEVAVCGYWPIKGEFDPMPALYRWSEGAEGRQIGLPLPDRDAGELKFRVWYPGCPMAPDVYGIPKPKGTELFTPQMVLLPCLGFGPEGSRLGYGGGFYERTLGTLNPRPITVGLCYSNGFLPMLRLRDDETPLDAMLTDDGVAWQR
jgi:5,10-methenyltetrahydrofolate synthetase